MNGTEFTNFCSLNLLSISQQKKEQTEKERERVSLEERRRAFYLSTFPSVSLKSLGCVTLDESQHSLWPQAADISRISEDDEENQSYASTKASHV